MTMISFSCVDLTSPRTWVLQPQSKVTLKNGSISAQVGCSYNAISIGNRMNTSALRDIWARAWISNSPVRTLIHLW